MIEQRYRKPQVQGLSPCFGFKDRDKNYAKSSLGFKSPLQISGKTVDGKLVVKGVFPIVSSLTGLPLDIIVEVLRQNDMLVDWTDFYTESIKGGWKSHRTLIRIQDALNEVYGKNFSEIVLERLRKIVS